MTRQADQEVRVYVGTYTGKGSEGIYVYRMKPSGELEFMSVAGGVKNPSFLAIAPQQDYLYAVSEIGNYAGKSSGGVCAYSIDPETGDLTFLNQQPSHGTSPCHLSVDRAGKFVFVANYGSGSVCVLPILDSGELGEATCVIRHQGSGADPKRQSAPHAHSINLDGESRYAFVPDLGLDRVVIYRIDPDHGRLDTADKPWAKTKPGAGPRHFAFHPNGRYAYVINELDSTMIAFSYDKSDGSLSEIQTVPTLPDDFSDTSYCADVHVLPSGRFVYGSNRGHDSIVIFEIDEDTGRLTYVDHEPTQGNFPRGFAIDPAGDFLLVANQNSDNIVTFQIDQKTGKLNPTGHIAEVSMPVCVRTIYA